LRNSLNVALPVTANFIDPIGLALVKSPPGYPGKAADGAKITVAKGSHRHRINPACRIARCGIATCAGASRRWRLQPERAKLFRRQAAVASTGSGPVALSPR
jgi:hypothetical protein